ncbi:hypothetical protein SUGI_0757740 [Cryptomeria japonica]|nr:hypothetical protein SUGI_0757740 [Cryptomeria japonica]
MLDSIYYDALRGKEEEVDELTHELEVTLNLLESTQLALQESQARINNLTVELSRAHSSPVTYTIQSPTVAVGDGLISMDHGCGDGYVKDVVVSITELGAIDSNGMIILVESSGEPHVAPSSSVIGATTSDAGQIADRASMAVMGSPESCELVHRDTPSSTQVTGRVLPGWAYGSQTDLFSSPGTKYVSSSHAVDLGGQFVATQSQSHQLQVFGDKVDSTLFRFYSANLFVEHLLESSEFQDGLYGATGDTLIRGSHAIKRLVGAIVDTLATMLPNRDFAIGFVEQVARGPTQSTFRGQSL